ncbi:methanol-5-hydroxybenzimidazolylcobamide co-methyltransferase, isozyme 1 [Methanosalsum zhilinae DSM 4017]|uniref:Methanol-5-hydroxybenzimidazolylcobamide co-methyltransferase, isozyme 1 n=1 Tax=Methanosalsum zhilinae (strain DSM 4017 / NBRC 107636 / OCM 62 / WeN5) TaxID=679901 RepID=F7XKS4_METZD|nr:methanol--corrinoid protein co-methyltransferase MtaB [Methanosalsum zhilinae]AEH61787.1 methanol-5-hydroxybenzimidazolylcobamide co-methyltransferase, isozyme 1 [Methanosalsum zhilinae DSM 4017]
MTLKRFTEMAYENADEMVFGSAIRPVKAGFGIEIGAGSTIPEINYAPRPAAAETREKIVREYEKITTDIMQRMIQLGFPAVVLETEHVQQMTRNPGWGAEVAHVQKTIMEEFHEEYGIKCALRHTAADIREEHNQLRLRGDRYSLLMESFEEIASSGADMLSIESMGGKEIFDHAILKNDMKGVLYSIGCLGAIDMEYLWTDIVKIAEKNRAVASGDPGCAQANTAMFIAGGLLDKNLAHTQATIARSIAASRSLVAHEAGATGPAKDCGYENTILKSIAGVPISQEGKSSSCAHSDIMGNLMMQCCDLWSNESVEYHGEFGGMSVQCWAETLSYDCSMLNVAIETGYAKILRDILMLSDRYRDPQGYVLAYDNAYRIGQAIVKDGDDLYLRAKNAALKCCRLLTQAPENKLKMSRFECSALHKARMELESFTDDGDQFMLECLDKYVAEVKSFIPANYQL